MTENITVYTQSSIRILTSAGPVYFDPFQMKEAPRDAAFVLITHDHYDHFSPEDLEKVISESTILIVPEKMEDKAIAADLPVAQIETVVPGEAYEIGGLAFETVPAYNKIKPFHPKSAGWVGYILEEADKRIYIAGDTDMTKENAAVSCDIALIPIGGTYTMDAKKAAELINTIRPAVVIPTHYGSIVGKKEDGDTFARLIKPPVRVELRL